MTYIRYKTFKSGTYAYQVTSTWDSALKRSINKSKYIGKVDKTTNQIIHRIKKPKIKENYILDFGDGYFLHEFIRNNAIYPMLKSYFLDKQAGLMPLIIYLLQTKTSHFTAINKLSNYQSWLNGNIVNILFKDIDSSTKEVIKLLEYISNEKNQNSFFLDYARLVNKNKKIVITSLTSKASQINMYFNSSSDSQFIINNNECNKYNSFKILYAINQKDKLPLYYRILPDESYSSFINMLETSISEFNTIGLQSSFAFLDTSYFSRANIIDLYKREIDFLIKVPNNRLIFKDIILNETNNLESEKYKKIYKSKKFFVKKVKVNLFNKAANAYIILDPYQKAQKIANFAEAYCEESKMQNKNQSKLAFASCGISILVSSESIDSQEILSCIYAKQSIEEIVSFSSNDYDLFFNEDNANQSRNKVIYGHIFLKFLWLTLYTQLQEKNATKNTIEKNLIILQRLKCKIFDNQVILETASEDQRKILEKYKISLPINIKI